MRKRTAPPKSGLSPSAQRIPLERQIELRFPNFEGLVTRISSNLSTSGMFIQTDRPVAVGTEFEFRFRIEDWNPIQGAAKVVWIRPVPEGPERPAGMGVEFLGLDPQSRRMIRWLVDKHVQEGGRPFDLDAVPAGASGLPGRGLGSTVEGPPHPSGPAAGYGLSRAPNEVAGPRRPALGDRRSRRGRNLALLCLALLVVTAGAYGGYRLWFGAGATRSPAQELAAESRAAPSDTAADLAIDVAPAGVSAGMSEAERAVTAVVRGWAAAWTSRQLDELMALYSPDFVPEGGAERSEWQVTVERQLREARFIRVAVSALEVSFPTSDTAVASFFRSFRSDLVDDTRRVIMVLELLGDGWKIRRQRLAD